MTLTVDKKIVLNSTLFLNNIYTLTAKNTAEYSFMSMSPTSNAN